MGAVVDLTTFQGVRRCYTKLRVSAESTYRAGFEEAMEGRIRKELARECLARLGVAIPHEEIVVQRDERLQDPTVLFVARWEPDPRRVMLLGGPADGEEFEVPHFMERIVLQQPVHDIGFEPALAPTPAPPPVEYRLAGFHEGRRRLIYSP